MAKGGASGAGGECLDESNLLRSVLPHLFRTMALIMVSTREIVAHELVNKVNFSASKQSIGETCRS